MTGASQSIYETAVAAGYPVITDPEYAIDRRAVRMIPGTEVDGMPCVALAIAGDVLAVVCPDLPTPAQFRSLETAAGCLVTLAVAPPEVFAELQQRAEQMRGTHVSTAEGTPAPAGDLLMDAPFHLADILEQAQKAKASDVHLSPASPPIARVSGTLQKIPNQPPLSAADVDAAATWLLGSDWPQHGEREAAVSAAGARWRVSCYRQRGATAIAMRHLPDRIPRLEELGLPAVVASLSNLSGGLILFSGPTGTGKSTSLAALIGQVNRTRAVHVLTIEDPVEYRHESIMATVHQREIGHDTDSFAQALRSALRQDPDVIMVGEMRDTETMRTALQAAETGHLVLSTVHAGTADEAVARIVDMFGPEERDSIRAQVAASLRAVVVQRLVPAKTTGRMLACEVMIGTPAVRTAIREGRLHEIPAIIEAGRQYGMVQLDRTLAELVADGLVSVDEATAQARDAAAITEHLAHLEQSTGRGGPA